MNLGPIQEAINAGVHAARTVHACLYCGHLGVEGHGMFCVDAFVRDRRRTRATFSHVRCYVGANGFDSGPSSLIHLRPTQLDAVRLCDVSCRQMAAILAKPRRCEAKRSGWDKRPTGPQCKRKAVSGSDVCAHHGGWQTPRFGWTP